MVEGIGEARIPDLARIAQALGAKAIAGLQREPAGVERLKCALYCHDARPRRALPAAADAHRAAHGAAALRAYDLFAHLRAALAGLGIALLGGVQIARAIRPDIEHVASETLDVARVIEPQSLVLAGRRAHDAPDFLHVAGQALAVGLAGNADKAVGNIKALCQHTTGHQPGDNAIGAAEFGNLLGPVRVRLVHVADLLEIVARRAEGRAQLAPMLNGGAENNRLGRTAKMLANLPLPFGHHVANDPDPGAGGGFVGKLAVKLQPQFGILGRLGNIDRRLNQVPVLDQQAG